jgi:hypothetical protein
MASKVDEDQKVQIKQDIFQVEIKKLTGLFLAIEPAKRELAEGLINEAAFLFTENAVLRQSLELTGMIRTHPCHPELQRPVEAARQYRQNVNSYAVIIKALGGILSKSITEEGDDLEEFE